MRAPFSCILRENIPKCLRFVHGFAAKKKAPGKRRGFRRGKKRFRLSGGEGEGAAYFTTRFSSRPFTFTCCMAAPCATGLPLTLESVIFRRVVIGYFEVTSWG